MLFNSLQFLVFFVIVVSLYFNLPQRFRPALLLVVSCYFYMSFMPVYLLIMGASITIAYIFGLVLGNEKSRRKKVWIILGILFITAILAFFKYCIPYNGFMIRLLYGDPENSSTLLSILLPVGLSFHTFQIISYMVEVNRGNVKPEKNFGIFALYVLFFPQLVAGPIERPQNLLPQFREEHFFNFENFKKGVMLMTFGFFKKVVIADRLAILIDGSYNTAESNNGSALLVATIFYSIQLYCDFSAYSEIAVGSAKIMGFRLTDNFNSPYFSKTISEFWTRWHISLSTWLRDYLFLPIAYKMLRTVKHKLLNIRPEVWSYITATIITMLIAGIWHGDTWAFVIWGLLHGMYLVISFVKGRVYKKFKIRVRQNIFSDFIRIGITFLVVSFAWIFFRAGDLASAFLIINKIFSASLLYKPSFALNGAELLFSIILIVFLIVKEKFLPVINTDSNARFFIIILIFSIFCYFFGVFEQKQFIYFQF